MALLYSPLSVSLSPPGDSPMDMSLIDGEERTQDPSEVPEYAKEIHTYLREVEVRVPACLCSVKVHCVPSMHFSSRWIFLIHTFQEEELPKRKLLVLLMNTRSLLPLNSEHGPCD